MSDTETAPVEPKAPKVKTVKMTRDKEGPEPHAADVHPDEVENYAAAGWSKA